MINISSEEINYCMIEFSDIVSVLTIGAAFTFGLLFFTARFENKKGNVFLGFFVWNLAYLELQGVLEDYAKCPYSFDATQFILVFLLFYLIRTANRPLRKWYYLLFLPGVIINAFAFFNDINLEENKFHYIELFRVFYLVELFLIVYFLRVLNMHQIKVNSYYSNKELKTLLWLKVLVVLIFLLHFTFILKDVVPVDNAFVGAIPSLIIFGMVYWIGLNGFLQKEVFKDAQRNNTKSKEITNTSAIDTTQEEFLALKDRIIKNRLYAKQNLTLRDLALSLNIKDKEISALIKLHSGTTFYHFINQFRIEEFKKTLNSSKSEQLSIFGLAQEVGFVSKSTFYKAFRAVEGMTPKQYESTLKEFD